MKVGIVGVEQAKLTAATDAVAREIVRTILRERGADTVISGRCHLGGIDILAVEEGARLGLDTREFPPAHYAWEAYKARNLQIVAASDEVYCITLAEYPPTFTSKWKFDLCYHCGVRTHVKSGGCWTVKVAAKQGKPAGVYVIAADLSWRKETRAA